MQHLSMRSFRVAAIAASAAMVSAAAPAAAQSHEAPTADALFRDGRKAAQRGDWEHACKSFAQSQRLDPGAGTLLNLATCEEHLGRLADALTHAREAARELGRGDDRATFAKKLAAELERRTPRLTLHLAADAPSRTSVTEGDTELGANSFGAPMAVDPGAHTLVVSAPGRRPNHFEVTLREGESKDVQIEAGPMEDRPGVVSAAVQPSVEAAEMPPESMETPAAPAPAPASGWRALGFVVGGLGVASLVAGGVTGGMFFAERSVVHDHCSGRKGCDAEGLEASSTAQRYATVSTVALAAGAVAVGTGLVLVLTNGRKQPTATVGTAFLPKGSAVMMRGTF